MTEPPKRDWPADRLRVVVPVKLYHFTDAEKRLACERASRGLTFARMTPHDATPANKSLWDEHTAHYKVAPDIRPRISKSDTPKKKEQVA